MPFVQANGVTIHYELDEAPGRPVVVFSNSLGSDLTMWQPQMDRLRGKFSILRYDTRGHGASSAPEGSYTLKQLGNDVLQLLDSLDLKRVHFCGLSLGGLIGQWLAIFAPERIDRLVLSNTAARIGSIEIWNQRIHAVEPDGLGSLVPALLDRWFTAEFRAAFPQLVQQVAGVVRTTSPAGYMGCCAALRDSDVREDLHRINAPTLVLFGTHDPVTKEEDAEFIVARVPQAEIQGVHSAHLASIESATEWTNAVETFLLRTQNPTDRERYEQGMKMRRAVLGDAHVDRSLARRTEFDEPFQDFITRYAWGEIWLRPDLSRHSRSLVTLALMIALNREEEFKMHIRAALNNGVARDEIRELLLHCSIYCGLPAANNAYQWARAALEGLDTI